MKEKQEREKKKKKEEIFLGMPIERRTRKEEYENVKLGKKNFGTMTRSFIINRMRR